MAIGPNEIAVFSIAYLQDAVTRLEGFIDNHLKDGKVVININWKNFSFYKPGMPKPKIREELSRRYTTAGWSRIDFDYGDQRDQIAEQEIWTFIV